MFVRRSPSPRRAPLAGAWLSLLLAGPALAGPSVSQTTEDRHQREGLSVPEAPPLSPEMAVEMSNDMLDASETFLRAFDFGNPAAEQQLQALIDEHRRRLADATPEELEAYAAASGARLPQLKDGLVMAIASVVVPREAAEKAAAESGAFTAAPGMAKSGGFPQLDPLLPDYPQVGAVSGTVDIVLTPFDAADAVARWVTTNMSGGFDIPLCWPTLSPNATGTMRPDRLNTSQLLAMTTAQEILQTITELRKSFCGGLSVDVTIVSLGASCDMCCVDSDLVLGIARLIYNTTMLCQQQIDGAELEAAFQDGRTNHAAIEHVHGDVENVQATANEILDAVACHPVAALKLHHGCDGADSDCNGTIDDCTEDAFGPSLHVDEAVGVPWYGSPSEAIAAVLRAAHAKDDCQAVTVRLDGVSGSCGAIEAVVTATDACGNETTVRPVVKVDALPPSVTIPASLAASCHASVAAAEAAVLGAALIADDCTPRGQLAIAVQSTVTDCSLRVRVSATDLAGKTTSDAVTVRVDTLAPVVRIDRALLGGAQPACFASVAEAEAAVLAAARIDDNCSAGAGLSASVTSSGSPCSLRVRVVANDECGRSAEDSVIVRVDGEAPVVTASVATPVLAPNNHELVDVGLAWSVADTCDGAPDVRIVVTSDESTSQADGAGQDKSPDAALLGEPGGPVRSVLLRAERGSSGNGRAYRIRVQATDSCGRTGTADAVVTVPPNGRALATDDGQYFDATQVN